MRFLLPSFVLIFFLACSTQESKSPETPVVSNSSTTSAETQPITPPPGEFDWLLGDWQRANNTKDKSTFEYWKRNKNGNYVGEGITLSGKDTVFQELMTFEKVDDIWNLKVSGVNEQPTYFKFTVQLGNTFVCVNPKNEFPKKISYQLKADKLFATISGDGQAVDFEFEKMKKQ